MPDERGNPYSAPSKGDESRSYNGKGEQTPYRWWWPLVASVALTPVALLFNVSYGSAHGDNMLDKITEGSLFPLAEAMSKVVKSSRMDEVLNLLQFPTYGALLSLSLSKGRFRLGCIIVAGLHIVVYFCNRFG